MRDLRIVAGLVDTEVTQRHVGEHLSLLEEERKGEEYMDRIFSGKVLLKDNYLWIAY